MPRLPLLLLPLLFSCGLTRYAPATDKKVTVEYVLRNADGSGDVWAVWQSKTRATGRLYYMAEFGRIPDSIKVGKVLHLKFGKAPDSCQCVTFKLIKK